MVDTDRLKKLRCAHGYYTAASFARALGMSRANYYNRENGIVPFTATDIVAVCGLLGISIEVGVEIMT